MKHNNKSGEEGGNMGKKIAITGGIGSGKSYVAEYIKRLGYPVFSCDDIYKEISNSATYLKKVKQLFPGCVFEGKIDRQLLAKTVFSDKMKLEQLNQLSHPLIMEKLYCEMDKAEGEFIFAEVPLLFEGGFEKDFHETIYVKRNLPERIQGVMQRDNLSEEEALRRIQNQYKFEDVLHKIEEEALKVTFLENDSTLDALNIKINSMIKQLKT